ncbi:PE-PPE domain-containing protein [Mycobacterium sp. SMC-4]|uniref:PE-PPE domain-containing protein n=1 Tax=Mycobacterium sp. SMC-4 TaxID=2857059 RepID=UPI0021B42B02|nr:PE-PPE domain-containing protein [Mycobacterium sp. SMC-4]UXA18759.1 PE-PPE domain-containing protein [Mycobacterium sp. SMC-4]
MNTNFRRAGIVCGAAFASVAVALSAATAGGAASSALFVGGIGQPSMPDILMAPLLGGAFKGQERVSVLWPAQAAPFSPRVGKTLGASINEGTVNLNAEIKAALERLNRDADGNILNGEKVTVVGLSGGALVVNEVLRALAADAAAPGRDQITFVLVADSSRQKIIDKAKYNSRFEYTYQPAPQTAYDVVVVTGEYDGMSDFPDRWWNTLAVMNAIAGSIFMHVPSALADLSKVPAGNITVDVNALGGTTTHYLVPAQRLPLVLMLPFLAPREAELKAKIDKAYSRNDVKAVQARQLRSVSEVPAVVSQTLAAGVESEPEVRDVDSGAAQVPTPGSAAAGSDADAVTVESGSLDEPAEADDQAKTEIEQVKDLARAEAQTAIQDETKAEAGGTGASEPAQSRPRNDLAADSSDSSDSSDSPE